jgi:non-homologous end joining protein Ku
MGRVVLARRERPFIVQAMGAGVIGFTLRYAQGQKPCRLPGIPKLELSDKMLEVAERTIEMKAGEFDPVFLEDRYRAVLVEKLREKQAGMPLKLEAAAASFRQAWSRSMADYPSSFGRSVRSRRSGNLLSDYLEYRTGRCPHGGQVGHCSPLPPIRLVRRGWIRSRQPPQ